MFPVEKSVYDWCLNQEIIFWVDWMETIPAFKPNPDAQFSQIVVPTADSIRYTYIIKALALAGKHVLCVGETGTGTNMPVFLETYGT